MLIESACAMKNKHNGICPNVPSALQSISSQQIHRYGCMCMSLVVTCKERQERSLNISLFIPHAFPMSIHRKVLFNVFPSVAG